MGWNEDEVSVYDVTEEMRVAASCGGMLKGRRGKENVGKGSWNPHHGSKQFSLCVGNQVFTCLNISNYYFFVFFCYLSLLSLLDYVNWLQRNSLYLVR